MSFTTTRGNVDYDLMPQYREMYAEGHFAIEQIAIVDWNDKDRFLSGVMPDVAVGQDLGEVLNLHLYGSVAGSLATSVRKELRRYDPQSHPNYQKMIATDYEVLNPLGYPKEEGGEFVTRSHSAPDGKCLIRLTWKALPYLLGSDASANANSEILRYCSIKTSYAGQNLEIPFSRVQRQNQFSFFTDFGTENGLVQNVNLRRPFSEVHVAITWHYAPKLPRAATMFMGRVNQAALSVQNGVYQQTFRPGTLLYLNAEVSEQFYTFSMQRVVNITYHFLWRDYGLNFGVGHNHFFNAFTWRNARTAVKIGGVGPVQDAPWPAGKNLFDYVDMINLFKIDSDTITYS